MTTDLARLQSELIAALVVGTPGPAGVDAGQLAAARRQLLDKRAGVVARLWPDLAHACGAQWSPWFTAWAAERPTVGARRDGYRFARWLAGEASESVPAEPVPGLDPAQTSAVAELLLSWQEQDGTLVQHRGPRRVRVAGRTFRAFRSP